MKKLILIALLSTFSVFGQSKVSLKLKLKKGDKYKVATMMKQNITQTFNGQEMKMFQSNGSKYTFDVIDVDDKGNFVINCKYLAVSMSSKNNFANVSYDSEKDKVVPAQAKGMAAMLNESFTMKMTPAGKVVEVKGIDKIAAKMIKTMGLEGNPMAQAQIKSMMSNEKIKSMMSQFSFYPDKAVGVNDKWKSTQSVNPGFKMDMDNTYTLTSIKGDDASVKTDTIITVKNGKMANGAVINLKGTQTGVTKLSTGNGMMKSAAVKQNIKGTISMRGLNIPMAFTTDTSMTVTK